MNTLRVSKAGRARRNARPLRERGSVRLGAAYAGT